jgi:hypothetical protein
MKCPPTTLKRKMIGFKDIFAVRTKGKGLSILANHYFEQGKKNWLGYFIIFGIFQVYFIEYPCFGRNSRLKKTQKMILECQVLDAIRVVPLSAKGRILPM